jgi:hypothetical protein
MMMRRAEALPTWKINAERRRLTALLGPARDACRAAYGTDAYEARFDEVRAITSKLADLRDTRETY